MITTLLLWFGKKWLFAKLNWFPQLLAFFKAHWRIIIVAAMLGYAYVAVRHAHAQRDSITAEFNTYKARIIQLAKERAIENEIKEKVSSKAALVAENKHEAELKTLNVDRVKIKKQLGDYYAKDTLNTYRIGAYDDRLRLDSTSGVGLPQATESTEYPEGRAECDAAIARLQVVEPACAVTTSDFNVCATWVENVCETFGCAK